MVVEPVTGSNIRPGLTKVVVPVPSTLRIFGIVTLLGVPTAPVDSGVSAATQMMTMRTAGTLLAVWVFADKALRPGWRSVNLSFTDCPHMGL